jgi:hypothetical protein
MAKRAGNPLPLLLMLVGLAAAGYFSLPYFAAASTLAALQARDAAAIARQVDFPALRTDLEADARTAVRAHFKREGVGEAQAILGDMVIEPLISALMKKFATPEGVIELADGLLRDQERTYSYWELLGYSALKGNYATGGFTLRLEDPSAAKPEPRGSLTFAQRGLAWKLAGADLPAEAFAP